MEFLPSSPGMYRVGKPAGRAGCGPLTSDITPSPFPKPPGMCFLTRGPKHWRCEVVCQVYAIVWISMVLIFPNIWALYIFYNKN